MDLKVARFLNIIEITFNGRPPVFRNLVFRIRYFYGLSRRDMSF